MESNSDDRLVVSGFTRFTVITGCPTLPVILLAATFCSPLPTFDANTGGGSVTDLAASEPAIEARTKLKGSSGCLVGELGLGDGVKVGPANPDDPAVGDAVSDTSL
jgi:hypothetical protein